jgi:lipopolysaccharide biosynthesis glycosyltransferase
MIITCAIDTNYIRHCAVMLRSLYEANPKEEISVYIIYGEIDAAQKRKLAVCLGKFLRSVNFVQIDPKMLEGLPAFGHLPLSTYYRLLIPTALPHTVQKAIFLDCDLIVVDSLSSLWKTPLGDYPLAAVTDHHVKENCERIGLSVGSGYFNGGVMLIDLDKWRRRDILSRGLEFVRNTRATLKHCDQDILNHLFEGRWLHLDIRWNAAPHIWGLCPVPVDEAGEMMVQDTSAQNKPGIVHFAGSGNAKPWHYKCAHPWKARYLELKKKTPWAGVPLDSQPPPLPVRLWNRALAKFKRLVKETLFGVK